MTVTEAFIFTLSLHVNDIFGYSPLISIKEQVITFIQQQNLSRD